MVEIELLRFITDAVGLGFLDGGETMGGQLSQTE